MRAKREYRNRRGTEVAVLDALVERGDGGLTVFELRAAVSVSIDDLEEALSELKDDDLIIVERTEGRTVIKPADRVIPDEAAEDEEESIVEWIRERFPF